MRRLQPKAMLRTIQVGCAGYFLADVGFEIAGLGEPETRDPLYALHLFFEALAVGFLLAGFAMGLRHERSMRQFGESRHQALATLRAHFDDLVQARFCEWSLSSAECDVALLAFRGLRISEIAAARGTREGTVKAQISSVFHKAGVTTRAEFMALFMDDFLDFGAASAADSVPASARETAAPPIAIRN
jgi:DNA-binding NarL/FixJ family response regulator